MKSTMSTILSGVLICLYFLMPIGWLYWLWLAIKIGGFAMFVVALFPLTAPLAGLIGLWSLLFGVPSWVFELFIK